MNKEVRINLKELELEEQMIRLRAEQIRVLREMAAAQEQLAVLNRELDGSPFSLPGAALSRAPAPTASDGTSRKRKKKQAKIRSANSENGKPKRKRMRPISIVTKKPIRILNPKTGQPITVGGEGPGRKRNRCFKEIVKAATKKGWKKSTERTWVVDMVAQCQRKGLAHFDESWIPADVQNEARKKNGFTPEQLSKISSDSVSSDSSEDEIELHKLEQFHGLFMKYRLKMDDPKFFGNGNGMHDDLAVADRVVTKWLEVVRQKPPYNGKAFKMYMEYSMLQGRGAIVDSKGNLVASDEQICVTVNSASGSKSLTEVQPMSKVGRQVTKCLSNVKENYENMKEEGSGWVWLRSVELVVSLNRTMPMVPTTGSSGEKRIKKMLEREDKGKEKEDVCVLPVDGEEEEEEVASGNVHRGGRWLDAPKWLKEIKAYGDPKARIFFNPRPKDFSPEAEMCFSWCVLAALHPTDVGGKYNRDLPVYKQTAEKRNWGRSYMSMGNCAYLYHAIDDNALAHIRLPPGISYPVPLEEDVFQQIEDLNPSFSVSVFCLGRDEEITPLYASRRRFETGRTHVRLGVVQQHKPVKEPKSAVGYLSHDSYNHHFVLLERFEEVMRVVYGKLGTGSRVNWSKTKTKKNGKVVPCVHYCDNCLNRFQKRRGINGLQGHMDSCMFNKPTQLVLPSPEDRFLYFKQFRYLVKHPFVIYADFEAVNVPVGDDTKDLEALLQARHELSKHEVSGWAYYICVEDEYKELFEGELGYSGMAFNTIRSYVGPDAMLKFWNALGTDVSTIRGIVCGPRGEQPQDWEDNDPVYLAKFREATHCGYCKQKFHPLDENGEELETTLYYQKRVMDHDHLTGKFRCVSHGGCNTAASLTKNYKVPVFFHNGKGYDFYHLIRSAPIITDVLGYCSFEVIAKSTQSFTSVSLNKKIRFVDSLQFMKASLDTLVRNAWNGGGADWNPLTQKTFEPVRAWGYFKVSDDPTLLRESYNFVKKGVYPYELARSVEDLFTYTDLPAKSQFASQLRDREISDGEYKRAAWAWKTFECKNLADFTQRYCELDVLLLASVFEGFRRAALGAEGYRLDPAHFLTAPSMAQSAMLLKNLEKNFVIETFSDSNVGIDGYRMAKDGIRGGICQVMYPYACGTEADADCEGPDAAEDRKVLYIDCNNLYGTAMQQPLPYGGYRWVKKPNSSYRDPDWVHASLQKLVESQQGDTNSVFGSDSGDVFELARNSFILQSSDMDAIREMIINHPENSRYGYLLCVDIDYPDYLHDLHDDMPFLPERKAPPDPSPYTRQQFLNYGASSAAASFRCPKLILDLAGKENYVVHYVMLKLALLHGLKLKAVHHVMEFKQAPFLKDYIDFNTEMRKKAKTQEDKDYWKGLNNWVFGKQMEDVESRRSVHLLTRTSWRKAVKFGCHPWMASWSAIIDDELLVMEKKRQKVKLDKPILIGQAILDLSKVIMYKAYYEALVPQFNSDPAEPRMKLLYMDTDSFQLLLRGKPGKSVLRDLYELQRDYDFFDLSEIQDPANNKFLTKVWEEGQPPLYESRMKNGKVLGKFKDEMKGVFIKEVVCLRPKMYSIELHGELITKHHNLKKAAMGKKETVVEISRKKGIPQFITIAHRKYRDTYFGAAPEKVEFVKIGRTKDLALKTIREYKVGISSNDDKSYWFDACTPIRYGHCFIREWKQQMIELLEEDPTLHPDWDNSGLRDSEQEADARVKRLAVRDLSLWLQESAQLEAPGGGCSIDMDEDLRVIQPHNDAVEALIDDMLVEDSLAFLESD